MNRRHFIKSAALAVVAVPVVGLPAPMPVKPITHPSPASSILLQWYYPGDHKRSDYKYWDTPTLEAWQDAKFQALIIWAEKAGCGYEVGYHEFDVLRFQHQHFAATPSTARPTPA